MFVGQSTKMTHEGFHCFITFTNGCSRYAYVYLIKNKFEALDKFRKYKALVKNYTGHHIKTL